MTVENIEKDMVIKSLWFDLASTVDYGPSFRCDSGKILTLTNYWKQADQPFTRTTYLLLIINYRLMPNGFGAATLLEPYKVPW